MTRTILHVDDEPQYVRALRDALDDEGFSVVPASNCSEAMDRFLKQKFDCVILDVILPAGPSFTGTSDLSRAGLALHREFRRIDAKVPIIFVTVVGSNDLSASINQEEAKYGLHGATVLVKPILPSVLVATVRDRIAYPS